VFAIIAFTIVLLLPFLLNLKNNIYLDYIKNNRDGFNITIFRSLVFAIVSTIFNILISFFGALSIKKISLNTRKGIFLSFLIIPFLLGNISIAFLFKIIFFKGFFSNIANGGIQTFQFIFLVAIQFWQFGLLFLYLFWLNFKNIPSTIEQYALVSKFDFIAKLKNIFIPQSKSLIILLSIFSFIFAFYENAKSQFIFKASQGTNTELISNWLYRNYQSKLLVNPNYAINDTFSLSFYIIILLSVILFSGIVLLNISVKQFTTFQLPARKSIFHKFSFIFFRSSISNISYFILLILAFAPIVYIFFIVGFKPVVSIEKLFSPFILTFIASIVAVFISLSFAISARIGWVNKLTNFNNYSVLFFISIFLLFLIPSIAILLSGFKWMRLFGYNMNISIYLIWIIGHSILILPLLASFLLTTHFRISNKEFSYLSTTSMNSSELVKVSFFSRFKLEYLFTLIVAYSFIWNESTINKIFSDRIPSFASDIEMQFIGRGSDYSVAMLYFFVSVFLSVLGVIIWTSIINRNKKQIN
jgi:ABC-type sugar transport system permease subunit